MASRQYWLAGLNTAPMFRPLQKGRITTVVFTSPDGTAAVTGQQSVLVGNQAMDAVPAIQGSVYTGLVASVMLGAPAAGTPVCITIGALNVPVTTETVIYGSGDPNCSALVIVEES